MRLSRPAFTGAVVCALGAAVADASIIYQAMNPSFAGLLIVAEPDETDSRVEIPAPPGTRENSSRAGDVITFAGTDRFVTAFTVRVGALSSPVVPVTEDVELTLYHVSGNLPGAEIWSGTITGVVIPGTNNAFVDVTFAPNVTVPNTIAFAIALSNIASGGRMHGLATQAGESIGSSSPTVIEQDSTSGEWIVQLYPSPFENVQARVTAVPAPGGPIIAGALLAGLLRRRRR